jgi:hypothetical protein
MLAKAMLIATGVVLGLTHLAGAQTPIQTPYPPWYQVQNTPLAWSYDPYPSGIGTCVQSNWGNSPPCRETIEPTYGQPNYWQYH